MVRFVLTYDFVKDTLAHTTCLWNWGEIQVRRQQEDDIAIHIAWKMYCYKTNGLQWLLHSKISAKYKEESKFKVHKKFTILEIHLRPGVSLNFEHAESIFLAMYFCELANTDTGTVLQNQLFYCVF